MEIAFANVGTVGSPAYETCSTFDAREAGKINKYDIVSYTVDSDKVYTLKLVADGEDGYTGGFSLTNGSNNFGIVSGNAANINVTAPGTSRASCHNADGKTIFMVADTSGKKVSYSVYEGFANVPTIKHQGGLDAPVVAVYTKDGVTAKVVFVEKNSQMNMTTDNKDVVFIKGSSVKASYTTALGTYFEYDAFVNGEEKTVKNTEAVIPFAGVVDCDGVTEETAVDLSYQIADCELNIVTESGTNRPLLAAKMNLLVGVEAWEEREICYISDAYSVSCPMECETEALKFRAAGRPVDIRQARRETIASGVTIKSVYMCSVSAENGAYHQTETGWEAAADVKIKLILEAEDGGVYSLVKNVAVSAPADGGAFEVGALTVTDKSFHISGNEDVEIRFTAVFHLLPAGGETFTQISAMRLLEPETKNKRQPSLTLCYAGAGESFWQLGKRLSATVADIQTANGLSGEFPPDGKLLLVPRRSQTEGRL